MEELLTLKEIAKRLDVPESNLRYYRNRIGDFLPSVGKGRRRRYFIEAEEIFKKTIEYINEGVTLDRVYAIFADNKPLTLKDDIARPAQEELAGLIAEKLRNTMDIADANPVSQEIIATLSKSINSILDDIREIKESLSGAGKISTDDTAADDYHQQIALITSENEKLKEELSEKEQIIKGQKEALLQAREKRKELAEALDQLRAEKIDLPLE